METPLGFIDRKAGFRLSSRPSVPLYAGARSAGIFRLEPGWKQPLKKADYLELFWCSSGSFHFPLENENRTVLLSAGSVMFLFPGDLHCQTVCGENEALCFWLTMDGHPAEIIRDYHLTREPFHAGEPPEALFQRLIAEISNLSSSMQYQASCTAMEILHAALSKKNAALDRNLLSEFCRLVEFHFSYPECNVEFLADQMHLSRVTLFRMVRASFGCSPKEYLERYRLRDAIKMLIGTNLPVKEIAIRCGYSYPNYFSRIFRNKMGCSPERFRTSGGVVPHR